MCLVRTPRVVANPNDAPKDPTVIRNPYLDGFGPFAKARRAGRASLRITRGSGVRPVTPPAPGPGAPAPAPSPVIPPAPRPVTPPPGRGGGDPGGGGGGGGGFYPVPGFDVNVY